MKIKFWRRFLVALTGLLLLAAGAVLIILSLGFAPAFMDLSAVLSGMALWQKVVMGGVGALLVLLGLNNVGVLFVANKTKGFIVQRTDYGDMSISMKALDTMTRKCVGQHKELQIKSTKIYKVKNGIAVQVRLLLETGVNIPLTVSALQKQVKQYIVSCSGVDVHQVQVLVETVDPQQKNGRNKEQTEIVVDNRKPEVEPQPLETFIEEEEAPAAPVMEMPAEKEELPTFEDAAPEAAAIPEEEPAAEATEEAEVAEETEETEVFEEETAEVANEETEEAPAAETLVAAEESEEPAEEENPFRQLDQMAQELDLDA